MGKTLWDPRELGGVEILVIYVFWSASGLLGCKSGTKDQNLSPNRFPIFLCALVDFSWDFGTFWRIVYGATASIYVCEIFIMCVCV